jgi:hypothetical protein
MGAAEGEVGATDAFLDTVRANITPMILCSTVAGYWLLSRPSMICLE